MSLDGVPEFVSGDVGKVDVGVGVDAAVLAGGLDVPTWPGASGSGGTIFFCQIEEPFAPEP